MPDIQKLHNKKFHIVKNKHLNWNTILLKNTEIRAASLKIACDSWSPPSPPTPYPDITLLSPHRLVYSLSDSACGACLGCWMKLILVFYYYIYLLYFYIYYIKCLLYLYSFFPFFIAAIELRALRILGKLSTTELHSIHLCCWGVWVYHDPFQNPIGRHLGCFEAITNNTTVKVLAPVFGGCDG